MLLGGFLAGAILGAAHLTRAAPTPLQGAFVLGGTAFAGLLAGVVRELLFPSVESLPGCTALELTAFETLRAEAQARGRPPEAHWAERLGLEAAEAELLTQRLAPGGGFE